MSLPAVAPEAPPGLPALGQRPPARVSLRPVRRHQLDNTSRLTIRLTDTNGTTVSTPVRALHDFDDFSLVRSLLEGGVSDFQENVELVSLCFSKPDPRGGAGESIKLVGVGAKSILQVYDHGNNLCAPKSLMMMAKRYD